MFKFVFAMPVGIALTLGGCGTYVPDIQEFPGSRADGQQLVNAIVRNIKCEVQDALDDLYRIQRHTFLDTWGVQVVLNLTIVETGAVNPTVSWMPPSPASAVFTLAAGGTLSSAATRTDKLSLYYTVAELRKFKRCVPEARPPGPFLLQSDLKLNEWLVDTVTIQNTGGGDFSMDTTKGPFGQSVLSHEVKFDIISSGTATPTWVLQRASINPTGTFLAASRERTHDVTITLGPTDDSTPGAKKGKPRPSRIAADAALASDIGLSVSTALKNQRVLP